MGTCKGFRYWKLSFVAVCVLSTLWIANFSRTKLRKIPLHSSTATNQKLRNMNVNSTREVTHIAFLKVHKAGSSTLQNIFYRFGSSRNLSFVLPTSRHYVSNNSSKTRLLIPPPQGRSYDILANHAVFNYSTFSKLLSKDTVYIAVVREPFEQFISAANYYRYRYKFKYLTDVPDDYIENLVLYPEKFEEKSFPFSYTRNSMARDFGFQPVHLVRNDLAREYLRHLDHVFSLVLVFEYMDESLVLMRRLLHWTIADILYIPINVGGHSRKTMNQSIMASFRKRNSLDYELYEHFYQKFWKQLFATGDDVLEEVLYFKRILNQVKHWCQLNDTSAIESGFTIWPSKWNQKIHISKETIMSLKLKELKFNKILQRRQLKATYIGKL